MAFALSNQNLLSKIATNNGHGEDSPYFEGWKAYDNDPFHPTKNFTGVIQMGLAENQLCFDLIEKWIMKHPEASICTPEGINQFKDIALYQDYHGLPAFRNAISKFMGRVRGGRVRFDPDHIVMSGGATGAAETIAFCLANPGEVLLVPSPYYPAFNRYLELRTGVQLLPVVCESSNGLFADLTIAALEVAYKKAQEANIKVKGLFINNPSNPLGTILDRETLRSLVRFINEKNINLVCHEIYAATVFSQPDFISISEIVEEDTDCNRDLIHILYSLSKDLGLPGFNGVDIIYSYNKTVASCARKMPSSSSTQTQHLIASMLSDDEFVRRFITESARRLAKRQNTFTQELAKIGINSLKSNTDLYLWMDLQPLLKELTVEAEMSLWHTIINDVKLNVLPGSSCHFSELGWFRVCFANMDDKTVEIALQRIRKFVLKRQRDKGSNKEQGLEGQIGSGVDQCFHARTSHRPDQGTNFNNTGVD